MSDEKDSESVPSRIAQSVTPGAMKMFFIVLLTLLTAILGALLYIGWGISSIGESLRPVKNIDTSLRSMEKSFESMPDIKDSLHGVDKSLVPIGKSFIERKD